MLVGCAEKRHKLAVHVISTVDGDPKSKFQNVVIPNNTNQPQEIQDITAFKSNHSLHPLIQPYINITRKGNKSKL